MRKDEREKRIRNQTDETAYCGRYRRPGDFKINAETMEKVINEYIAECVENGNIPCDAGLCCRLGIIRETLKSYKHDPIFIPLLSHFAGQCEEIAVNSDKKNGGLFLKTKFGYSEKTEIVADVEVKKELTIDDRQKILDEIKNEL